MKIKTLLLAGGLVKNFREVGINDVSLAGGKNASLGEMMQHLSSKGIKIPEGFIITAAAYWEFIVRAISRRATY